MAIKLLAIVVTVLHVASPGVSASTAAEDSKSSSMVGFCDQNFWVPRSKKSCSNGFNFGKRTPKCVCIKGIYRMYLSNCEVADGFAEEVCTLLTDLEQQVTVKGIKLTKEPRWDKTALVCERGTGTNKDWEYVTEFGKARTFSTSFYTIHGDAFTSVVEVEGKKQQQICVQKKIKETEVICQYKHHDNIPDWTFKEKSIEIIVKTECPSEHTWKPMTPHRCFDPLTLADSECQVPCSKANIQEQGMLSYTLDDEADLEKPVVDIKPYHKHDNDYLDRKLNTYWVLQEIGVVNITPINTIDHGPNKTFDLFEIMTNITKNYCPNKYVPKFWVSQVVELFHVLHHGDIFKYDSELNEDEYRWIRDILMRCHTNKSMINLVPETSVPQNEAGLPDGETCDFGVKRATGYCQNNAEECEGEEIHSPPNLMYNDYMTKHFVPEVSWLVLDIVHVVCFPQFNESYRMFHLLEQTIEKLFTTQIKNYWFYPTWSDKMKRSMLGYAADDYMWNMEVCAQSAYSSNKNVVHRLVRPDPLKYLSLQKKKKRRKRSAEALSNNFDISCAKNKADFVVPDKCENMKVHTKIHKPELIHPKK